MTTGGPYDHPGAYDPNAGYTGPPVPLPGGYPPPAAPGYPPPGAYPAGYPGYPPPSPYGYPPAFPPPIGTGRPGTVIAAGALAYVNAGLLILAGALLVFGASAMNDFDNEFGSDHSSMTAELVIDGLLNFKAAGLLIAGGVSLAGRKLVGRTLLSVGGGLVIAEALYWLIRAHEGGAVVWAVIYAGLAIIAIAFAWTAAVTNWLRSAVPS